MNLDEIKKWIKEYEEDLECYGTCGKKLSEVPYQLQWYPHDGGVEIEGLGKQWVYVHCFKCRYNTALWKLQKQIERRKNEARK